MSDCNHACALFCLPFLFFSSSPSPFPHLFPYFYSFFLAMKRVLFTLIANQIALFGSIIVLMQRTEIDLSDSTDSKAQISA